jgi:hypothetical protein
VYAAIPTIVVFLLIEALFRVCAVIHEGSELERYYERLATRPAYASKPWFCREFIASSLAQEGRFYTPRGTDLLIPKDHKDRFITVQDGIRGTVGFDASRLAPNRRPRKLFVFGGSTTYCEEVPDEFTWASQLQKMLAVALPTADLQVVNCGVPAFTSFDEVRRLEYEIGRGNLPDICLFFDGLNDSHQGFVSGRPGQTTVAEGARKYADQGLVVTLRTIAKLSVAAQTIYRSILSSQRKNDPAPRPEADASRLARTLADVYEQNILRAQKVCNRYGIRMMVFLQPHVFTIARPWTSDETAAANDASKIYAQALRSCYPLLREKLDVLRDRGVAVYDITDAFDRNLEPIFVDGLFHVESTGNRLIAEAIL